MYELKVVATKVMGTCTADPPVAPGDHFFVRDGDLRVPEGGYICLWALQSLLPVITPKEREIAEDKTEDWMWRVHHVQCPDPKGRVIFKIERTGPIVKQASQGRARSPHRDEPTNGNGNGQTGAAHRDSVSAPAASVRDLRVVVESVRGRCTSGLAPGDSFVVRAGRIYVPPGRHFCLYALGAALPLLPAKQRQVSADDWMSTDNHVICPDPAGNVIMRIEPLEEDSSDEDSSPA